jgi:Methyl-accepting chemotaxis protein
MKWFSNLKIKVKLMVCFSIITLFTVMVGFIGIGNMKTINKSSEDMYKNSFLPAQNLQKIQKSLLIIRSDYLLMVYEKDTSKLQQRLSEINKLAQENNEILKDYETTIQSIDERNLFNILKSSIDTYQAVRSEYDDLLKVGNYSEAQSRLSQISTAREKVDQAVEQLIDFSTKSAETKYKTDASDFKSQSTFMIIVIIIGALLAISLGFIVANMISKPLTQLVKVANSVTKGDLDISVDVDGKDEVGILAGAFMAMTKNMNDVMSNINAAAEQVASGARQVSSSSMALSQGSTEQASSIEQLTASIEEIAAQTRQNADSANKANEIAEATKENAIQGNEQMKEMLKSMDEINESSSNISKIIKVIDEIAFQTNILALNAAVEAARAGQHGKGFAVVAEEVRNLAARSANAAKETTAMIEGSIKKVEGGTKIADETAGALSKIVQDIAKVAVLVDNIATASNEQAAGVVQINQGIMQVAQVVQTNSVTSEESAAASEELSSQAELLREQVGKFKLKKANNYYNKTEELSPEVIKFLKDMNEKKKYNQIAINQAVEEAAVTTTKSQKIALSDKEFGKY